MSVGAPWFLCTLFAVPIYVWLRRRANLQARTEFTGAFLIRTSLQEGVGGRYTRIRFEDVLCCACIVCLSFAGAEVSLFNSQAVVIANGPVTVSESLARSPMVRAGIYPSAHSGGSVLRAVDTAPDWANAVRFAHAQFPGHSIHLRKSVDALVELRGAGIRRSGREWTLGVQVPEEVLIRALSPDGEIALRPTSGGFASGALIAGTWIELAAQDHRSQYVCGVGKRLLSLRKNLLPESIERGLSLHPLIQLVDRGGDFEIEKGPSFVDSDITGSPFPVQEIRVVFEDPTESESLELRLSGALSLPVAQVHEWTALAGSGKPFLFGGIHELLTFSRSGSLGVLRFGFRVEDTDLVDTAGWPVLMMQIGDYLAGQTRGCFESEVGQVIEFESQKSITVVMPGGAKRMIEPVSGMVSIGGIDEVGRYKLEQGARSVWLMARALTGTDASNTQEITKVVTSTDASTRNALSLPFVFGAAGLLCVLALTGTRRRWYLTGGVLLVISIAPNANRPWFGHQQRVTVLLDVSPSMAGVETSLEALMGIDGLSARRVDFAQDVVKVVNLEQPPSTANHSVDLPQVLSSLTSLGKGDDAILLITDGRFDTPELSFPNPVYIMTKAAPGKDPRLVSATAVEMPDGVYIRAIIATDGPIQGELLVRGKSHPFTFGRSGLESMSVMLPTAEIDRELVEIKVLDDRDPSNNRIRVDIQRPLRSDVLVLGQCAVPLNRYLKDAHHLTRFEQEMDFSKVQLAVICDQSIEQIPASILSGLSKWLENGGTLLLAGRENAFGNGGWGGSVLEEVSPFRVDPEPEGRGVIQMSVALDTSGSMSKLAGGVGLDGLRKIVPKWVSMLHPGDRISIAGFDTRVAVLIDDVQVSDWLETDWKIPMETGGGTRFSNLADWVVNTAKPGTRRYLLLVTDGSFADKDEVRAHATRLSQAGVSVLAVGVGKDVDDEILCSLAQWTGGQCLTSGVEATARFVSSAMLSNDGALDVVGGLVSSTPLWKLRVGGGLPSVERKIRVSLDENARVLAQQESSPLAAERHRGLGRVIGIATDNWALSHEQWRNLLSPALNQRDVNFSMSIMGNRLNIKGRPMMPVPNAPPSFALGSDTIEGSPWQLIEPGHFASALPKGLSGEMTATVMVEKTQYHYRFEFLNHAEWTHRQGSRGPLMSLASRTNGSMVQDVDALRQVLSTRQRVGGIPAYFFILLGVILWILLSVRVSKGTVQASLAASSGQQGV